MTFPSYCSDSPGRLLRPNLFGKREFPYYRPICERRERERSLVYKNLAQN